MLLRIFKNNNTAGFLLIPLITVLAWLPGLRRDAVQQMVFDIHPMPLYRLVINYVDVNSLLATLLAIVIVLIIGFYLIKFNSTYNVLREKSLLPTFLFLLFISCIPVLHRLSPALLSMVFFIPALDKLLASYKTERLSYNYFEASFLIGAGSLMYFNLIYYIILVWVALFILRPVIWREWIFSILGVITPWFFYVSGYFLLHDTIKPVQELVIAKFTVTDPSRFIFLPEIIYFSYLLILIIVASRHITNSMPKMKVLSRKIYVLFFWTWALSVVLYLLIETANIELIVFAAIPVSFLLSHYILFLRSGFWSNLFLWVIMAGTLILAWFPGY